MPSLFIITGSNGSGKSTVGPTYLPPQLKGYKIFDGDKAFMQRQRDLYLQLRSYKEARKQAEEWVQNHFTQLMKAALASKDHFAYEGHFTMEASWKVPKRFKKAGYVISLIFFGLEDPDISELRVAERVKGGGHNVSRTEIEMNFFGNIVFVNKYFKVFDDVTVFDTSRISHKVLFHSTGSNLISYAPSSELPDWFIKGMPKLYKMIVEEEKKFKNTRQK